MALMERRARFAEMATEAYGWGPIRSRERSKSHA